MVELRTQTVVIGAGPAGLAVAACLKRRGAPFVILDRAQAIGASWRRHYDRLHLHTDRAHSSLPELGFPPGTPRYPSRDQVSGYLELYARRLGIDPRLGEEVRSIHRDDGEWVTETTTGLYRSSRVVVASGYNAVPSVPSWPGQERFRGPILHSSDYRNGERFHGQRVLVVGLGNSGGEIAIDLHEHGARVAMAVRGPVNLVPREILGVPIVTISILLGGLPARLTDALAARLSRIAIGDITRLGLKRSGVSPLSQIRSMSRIPLIDIGTVELIRAGHIEICCGVRLLSDAGATFEDGSAREIDAIIAATGFRPGVERFLDPGADTERDGPVWPRSRVESRRGLYFCGFTVTPGGMLREIGVEARRIAAHITRTG